MFSRVYIQHELPECTLHSRDTAFEHREARAAHLCGGFKIYTGQCGADIDVILWHEIEYARRTEAAHLHIFGLRFSWWHFGTRDIRNKAQKAAEFFLQLRKRDFVGFEFVTNP